MKTPKKEAKLLKLNDIGINDPHIEEYSNPSDFSMSSFGESTKIEIIEKTKSEVVFDLIGVSPSIANALRRIFISEIPTMAIEKVIIYENSSVIPDEVLSQRLGLIPILADAEDYEYKKPEDPCTETNSIFFKLSVKCSNTNGIYENQVVYSNELKLISIDKKEITNSSIKPVYGDIIINKLAEGQSIDLIAIAVKGIGKTHAKWSPVCTAFYRLMNNISFNENIMANDAMELYSICPNKVFEIVNNILKVKDKRKCTTCRECIRVEKFTKKINLEKISDYYEFHVESVGIYDPETLIYKALKIIKDKCDMWSQVLLELKASK